LRLAISKSSSPMSWPARRACAIKWMIALVEQPIAIATVMAFSKALRVWIRLGVRSSHTISTMRRHRIRRPCGYGRRRQPESTRRRASVMPIASAIAVMVEAVPMVMQVP